VKEARGNDLVLVATFDTPSEAEVVASLLRGEGIPVMIDRPFVSGVRPDWLFGRKERKKGVRLLVRIEDEARSREILDAEPDLGGWEEA
jgi:hypothetical protein